MAHKKEKIFLIALFAILLILNYKTLDGFLIKTFDNKNEVLVKRIVDGDTIVANNETIRLLGINTPERGEKYYLQAKEFLEKKILNKNIKLEFVGETQDKYYRTLAYVFLDDKNINVEIVKNGFANYYFYDGKDKYSKDLENAWTKCLEDKINLCKPSSHKCSSCVAVNSKKSIINNCEFSCDINNWEIKGEGRKKFIFNKTINSGETLEFDLDISSSGGTLFLRDSDGDLVFWKIISDI
jgi:endonuclease YncB( thermonuclease family)